MKAYMDEIIQEEDFSTEYKLLGEKLSNLEQEKIIVHLIKGLV